MFLTKISEGWPTLSKTVVETTGVLLVGSNTGITVDLLESKFYSIPSVNSLDATVFNKPPAPFFASKPPTALSPAIAAPTNS